ncbi:MAG: hypothetical protein QNJ70_27335 [Xenococcaceae cyanobacterium MO_207.B15]|nr:hypothetical protein [Xenococcaceae cyanobacterium MO_207.B15]
MCYRNFDIRHDSCLLRFRDYTNEVSQEDIEELGNFVLRDILSTSIDIDWLGVIRIQNHGNNGVSGRWSAKFYENEQNPNEIRAVVAVITLNYYYLKFSDAPPSGDSLGLLKETLAHEYGHHWTLLHCIKRYGLSIQSMDDLFNYRLPEDYYQVRGLNYQDYFPDYSFQWHRCDKEIIAEDYRILFAPEPHNENHQCIIEIGEDLESPNGEVERFIRNLNRPLQ